jgi:type 1 glutamine amidotransferase
MMARRISLLMVGGLATIALIVPVAADQGAAAQGAGAPQAGAPAAGGGQGAGRGAGRAARPTPNRQPHVYIRAGLKSHGPGQHDYPQFLADWSKILTEHGAIVDGGLHFPTAEELRNIDVIVMYKGDAGYLTPREKAVLEDYLRDGGGLVGFHDAICAEDAEWFGTIFGGAKKHGQVNYTLDAKIPYTVVDKANPITQGMSDFQIEDESFYLMSWSKQPEIKPLLIAKIDATPTAVGSGHAGESVAQAWTYEKTLFGGQPYRAFVWMQGHTYANFANPQIQPMLLRGIAWAAKYPVDALANVVTPAQGGGARGAGRGGLSQ